jgi:long-chain acyl-CoA synthetase
MNAGILAVESIDKFGEFESLYFKGQAYTNVERLNYAMHLAGVLQEHGVKPGDRVAVMMANCPEVYSAFHAIWRVGAAILPVIPQLTPNEVHFLLEDSGAKVVLTSPQLCNAAAKAAEGVPACETILCFGESTVERAIDIKPNVLSAPKVESLYDANKDDMCILMYTSGTTGKPKGVMLSHNNILVNHRALSTLRPQPQGTRGMSMLPMSHIFGVLTMNLGYIYGSTGVLHEFFNPIDALETIQDFKVQRFGAVPTMLTALIHCPGREDYDVSSLEQVGVGASALLNETRLKFEELFGCEVIEGYGMTECGAAATSYYDGVPYRPGSVGQAIPSVEVEILDDDNNILGPNETGEICMRGEGIMQGYWNRPDATEEALKGGWLHSGDIGYKCDEGFVRITDRKKDLIIKGGENISAREIEEALYQHPAVIEAAVVAVPDEKFGETIAAAIVLNPTVETNEQELGDHLREYITKFKLPTYYVFKPMLPKNSTGKILKRTLREEVAEELSLAPAK